MRLRFIAGLCAVAAALVQPAKAQPAERPVGVQRLLIVDDSRPQLCATRLCPLGRQIPVLLFYPARAGGGRSLTFEELGNIGGGASADALRKALQARNRELLDYTARKYQLGEEKAAAALINQRQMQVFANAAPAPGRFPLLLYAGGANFMVQENVGLWRALAAHGYVVAAIPTIGASSIGFSADAEGLETLSRDLEVALARVHVFPHVDDRKIGLLGFSYGGAAAMLSAMREPSVAAVIGYDPSFISRNYSKALKAAPQFSADRFAAPLLDVHARADDVTAEVVQSLRYSRRRSIEIPGAEHLDFTEMPEVALAVAGDRKLPLRSLNERASAHRALIAETLVFLDHALKDLPDSARHAFPQSWTVTERGGLPLPPTSAELVAMARRQGYEAALRELLRIQASDPTAALLAGPMLNNYGYSIKDSDPPAALLAFRLNLAANPRRVDYWDSLADGFLALNDKPCAAAVYRAELAVMDRNSNPSDSDRSLQKAARQFLDGRLSDPPCRVELPQPR